MTLDATKPTDQAFVSELAAYIRETRVAVNTIAGDGGVGVTTIEVGAGVTSLSVVTDLGSYGLEVVIMSGAGAAALETILGGTNGQIKALIFQDNNVDIVDGNDKVGGKFYLNSLPAGSTFAPQQDDILAIVNVGGDAGATTHGYWKELFRNLSVK